MPYCSNCGNKVSDNAKFCDVCGTKILSKEESNIKQGNNLEKRKTIYDGEVHKCPNCGEVLNSFLAQCPTCGFELRGQVVSSSVSNFFEKINSTDSIEKKIGMVKTFPIPNDKESILEFMFLACSNFDEEYYATHLDEDDISDAWLMIIEKCYKKGKYVLTSEKDIQKLEEMYNDIKNKTKKTIKKKNGNKILGIVAIILGAVLAFTGIGSVIGLVLILVGVVLYINSSKTNYKTTGFRSWNPLTQFFWLFLNVLCLGIPAIIYASKKKK